MSLFVDTSIWYAAADLGDRDNADAISILSAADNLVTSDHVLVESWLLLRRSLNRHAAEAFWEGLREAGVLVEPVGLADLEVARVIGQTYKDQDFSIVDRTSFVVMQRLGISQVATLDSHFSIYRFGPNRDRFFTIARSSH